MVVGAAPALLTFFIRIFVPESERWKASMKTKTGNQGTLRELLYTPRLLKHTLFGIAFASIALIGTWGSVQWLPLWADQMTGGKEPTAKAMTQILSGVGAIIGCFIGPWIGGRMGRRPAYFILCLASVLLCGLLFRTAREYNTLFLLMVGAVGCVTAAFYGWFPLYLPELFPTRVRATGQGLSYNFGRILAAAGALSQGQLVAHYGGSYAQAGATITLIYILGLFLIWLAPETRGKPLPE
jgi:predicted MFS family arabinose efflux permease